MLAGHPDARHLGVHHLGTLCRIVHITTGHRGQVGQASVDHHHPGGLVGSQGDRLVKQVLVGHGLAAAHAGVGAHNHFGLSIVDATGQGVAGKTTEHHRMNGPNAHAGQHGKAGLGNHGHVDQHAIALADPLRLQDRCHAIDFNMQLAEGIRFFGIGLGRDEDQRVLIRSALEVAIERVVAEIGLSALEPLGKRRLAVVAHLLKRLVPVDQRGLFGPECIAVLYRALVKIGVIAHGFPSKTRL